MDLSVSCARVDSGLLGPHPSQDRLLGDRAGFKSLMLYG